MKQQHFFQFISYNESISVLYRDNLNNIVNNAADTQAPVTELINNAAVIGPPELFDRVPGPPNRTKGRQAQQG